MAEVHNQMGLVHLTVNWDLEKFFDTICWVRLAELAGRLEYPTVPFILAAQVHLAGRILTGEFGASLPVFPRVGVLQGCGHSVNLAKVLPLRHLEQAHRSLPFTTIRTWVDDMPQTTVGTLRLVRDKAPEAAVYWLKALRGLGLKPSKKTAIVANPQCGSRGGPEELGEGGAQGEGCPLHARPSALTPQQVREGGCRSGGTAPAERFEGRAESGGWFGRGPPSEGSSHRAPLAQLHWGVEQHGVSPTELRKWRAAYAGAAGYLKSGGSTSAAIRLHLPTQADPGVAVPSRVVKAWVGTWRKLPTQKRRLVTKVWPAILGRLEGKRYWGKVRGPVSALIATMKTIGWTLASPTD